MIYLGVLTLAFLGGVLGDGYNSILSLPGPDNTDNYVRIDDPFTEDLSDLTMCVWLQNAYADSSRYFLSYSSSSTKFVDNELIFGDEENRQGIWRGGSKYFSGAAPKENVWCHVCWTWCGETGATTLRADGEKIDEGTIAPNTAITAAGGILILGQEQDTAGGSFSARQSWLGRMYNMNIWDRALNETELTGLYELGFCGDAATLEPLLPWGDILEKDGVTNLKGDASILVGPCDDAAEEASYGKVLRFPPQSEASISNFLQFTPDLPTEFTEFSVCTWFFKTYSDTGRYFLSYADTGSGGTNSIILGENADGLGFWVNNVEVVADVHLDQNRWYHMCFTWGTSTGAQIYLDGEMIAEDADLAAGVTKQGGGALCIGQEQDKVGGGYSAGQAFAGSLYNLNIYSHSLTADDVTELYADGTFCHKSGSSSGGPAKYMRWGDLNNMIIQEDNAVVFEDGEEAWRHGAPLCGTEKKDEEAHNPTCWIEQAEGVYYKEKTTLGFIAGDVDIAKSACFATKTCQGLTCANYGTENVECHLKVNLTKRTAKKAKKAKNLVSFRYEC